MLQLLTFIRAVPWWAWVGAGLLAAFVGQSLRLSGAHADLAEEQAAHSKTKALYASAAASASEAYRGIEQGRQTDKQEIQNEADTKTRDQLVDRSAYDDVSRRLRDARTALATSRCPAASNPGASAPGQAASSAGDLYADMQSRLDAAESAIADFADASSIAGHACQQSYQSLTPTKR